MTITTGSDPSPSFLSHLPSPLSSSLVVADLAQFLSRSTPIAFRQAVRKSGGRFLYRGADNNPAGPIQRVTLQDPEPDLLLPGTYDDPAALTYFECLEHRLMTGDATTVALPSNGHVGTSDVAGAEQWGPVVSVWPLGEKLFYVWQHDRETFFPPSASSSSLDNILVCAQDRFVIDSGLEDALRQKREVLFYSSGFRQPQGTTNRISPFLTIPMD